jgi:hypothetical protein
MWNWAGCLGLAWHVQGADAHAMHNPGTPRVGTPRGCAWHVAAYQHDGLYKQASAAHCDIIIIIKLHLTVIHLRVLCCAFRTAWDGAVAKPLEAASEASRGAAGGTSSGMMLAEWGRRQLLQLLTRIMIRSCKADLALLPPCYKKVGWLRHAAACHAYGGAHVSTSCACCNTDLS